jgi:predicted nuclease of predicted toxin-antitoxin system
LPRFLLDENVPHSLSDLLKRRGFEVRFSTEVRGTGLKNSDLVNIAREADEIILIFDADFLSFRLGLRGLARIVYIDMHPRNPRKAKIMLEKWIDECLELLKQGNTVKLSETGPVLQTGSIAELSRQLSSDREERKYGQMD